MTLLSRVTAFRLIRDEERLLADLNGLRAGKSPVTHSHVPGALAWNVRVLSANATAAAGDWCDVSAAAAARTITLPSASANTGKSIMVSKSDSSANTVTISGTINGQSSMILTKQYTMLTLTSNGTEWRIT